MKILAVEDDRTIAAGLVYALEQEGYEVCTAFDVKEAKEKLRMEKIDLCLLDLSLPDGSGYEICKEAKEAFHLPVIFLTAYDDEINVVMGLDMGADDYVTKPFRVRELMSRIKSVLRRYQRTEEAALFYQCGKIRVVFEEGKVYKDNKEVSLTAMEYRLLLTLINNRGKILTRNQLLEGIWDVSGDFVNDNTLTVYIKRLREKLEDDPANPVFIRTVRGMGYIAGG